jgi:hypothetical protein
MVSSRLVWAALWDPVSKKYFLSSEIEGAGERKKAIKTKNMQFANANHQ